MREDIKTSKILAEIAEMSRELQQVRLRAKWVKTQIALTIAVGAITSGLLIAVNYTAEKVRTEVVSPAH